MPGMESLSFDATTYHIHLMLPINEGSSRFMLSSSSEHFKNTTHRRISALRRASCRSPQHAYQHFRAFVADCKSSLNLFEIVERSKQTRTIFSRDGDIPKIQNKRQINRHGQFVGIDESQQDHTRV